MNSSESDLPQRLAELERENQRLRAQVQRLGEENRRLRRALAEAWRAGRRQAAPFSKGTRKPHPRRPGRKPGQGRFRRREAPAVTTQPPVAVPVSQPRCPFCGGELEPARTDRVTVTDIPEQPTAEVKSYEVAVCRCTGCGRPVRGQHPEVAPDQYGATAHRVGPRVMAVAHALHYGWGVPVRKAPGILKELTGVEITQSAITQDGLKRAEGALGQAYGELREGVRQAPVVHTDDTGWRVGGEPAQLMVFDTDEATVYQVRPQHRNEEVRELVPADYPGVLVSDRGKSYDAEELSQVAQQKCLAHVLRNVSEVVDRKQGRARQFGLQLKLLLQVAIRLWHARRQGLAADFAAQAQRVEQDLTHHLRNRILKDDDNQRLLNGIGAQHDQGNLLRFLHHPSLEPTNNRAERALRGAVIARKVSQCSKNHRGAEALAAFTSVARTSLKRGTSITAALYDVLRSPRPQGASP